MRNFENAFHNFDAAHELPSVNNFIQALQKCRKGKNLVYSKLVHARICNNGLEAHRAVGNYIVPMFVECGNIPVAQQVFNRLVHRNEHSWTSLMLGYVQSGQSHHTFNLYQKMQEDCIDPSSYTFMALIKACARLKNVAKGQEIHVEIIQKGFHKDLFVGNTLVDMYAKCGSISEAQEVFDKLPVRDVVSWNALITGYAEYGPGQEALKCFDQMKLEGISPTAITFVCILKACGSLEAIDKGRKIHLEIRQRGFDTDPYVGNSLVDMYANCGLLLEAREAFDKLPVRDVVSWNALITGYSEYGPGQEALKCFEQMQLEGISPDLVTFVCSLKACGRIRAIEKGREIHDEVAQRGFERDIFVSNTLIDMYAKFGLLSEAFEVFDKLQERDIVSWNALIAGYAQHGPCQKALQCFEQMQIDGISPCAVTFICILKACGNMRAIDKGREVHEKITEKGFERHPFVGNSLVDMYAKCGSLLEAREVFNLLPVRDVAIWNALIAGYAEHGLGLEALICFEQMQLEGVSPDAVTFVYGLKACGNIGAIDKGREIHAEIKQKGFGGHIFVGNSLVNMYAKCGLLSEAREVFDELAVRDGVLWTTLIAGYIECGLCQEALKCFELMLLEGISPNTHIFICILKVCGGIGAIDKGREIHTAIADRGFEGDLLLGNALVDMYAKCGSLPEALQVFDKLPFRDVVSWNALIAGYAEHGPAHEALKYFEEMQREGVCPNAVTFVCSLKACGRIGAIEIGRGIHIQIVQRGFERDLFVGNTLVDMYAKCGMLSEARDVFDNLPDRDVVSWNALIAGYAEHGSCHEVLKCFEQMQLEDISPSAVTFIFILKACGSIGAMDKCREVHREIKQKGFDRNRFVGNSLVDMYAKCGLLLEARENFEELAVRDVVSWNALIGGYADHGPGHEALKCFEQMKLDGVSPDAVTFFCGLKACGKVGAIDKGREIHAEITQRGFGRDLFVSNNLIDMYAKCGSITEARGVFDKLPVRDVVSWDVMINGYGMNHEGNMAVQCFEDMQKQCVKPNAITFTCLLTACSHASLVLKGQEYFKTMREDYGIIPTVDHCTCMVDLLARSGHLYDAANFLKAMPHHPSIGVWTALLSACKTYGEAELGQRCFQELVQINPEYSASYVLMANIYASAGKQDDAFKIEEMRMHVGAKKKPASALIEVDKKVHEFVVGNNQSKEISAMLEILGSHMEEEGHVPKLELILKSIPDREKENALCEHAEKLALAFGLLNTPQGETLRIVKNMRMCNNCHNGTKIISTVERREIIVRDGYCIHHFKDGLCSCGDVF